MKAGKLCSGILLGFLIVCFGISNQSVKAESVGGFEVTGGSQNTDYSYENGILKINTGQQITIKNLEQTHPITDRIQIAEGVQADVILNNVLIGAQNGSAFELLGNAGATITLQEGSKNQLKTFDADAAALQKDGSGQLTIQGTGTLEAEAKAGAGIGGSKPSQNVCNITIQGNCMVDGKSESGSGIGAGKDGNASKIQILGESTIVKCSGESINVSGSEKKDWQGLVFEKGRSNGYEWRVYNFVLDRDLAMDEGSFVLLETQEFRVREGKTLTIDSNVNLDSVIGKIYNDGKIIHSSQEDFPSARIMPGRGVFEPKLQGKLRIADIEKEYIGHNVQLEADFYDEQNQQLVTRDYGGEHDGAPTFKWYKNGNGQAGDSLNAVPKDAGVYYVGISVAEGNFFTAVTEQKAKVIIEKATSTVRVTAGPAIVNQRVRITATVTGVNGEQPTGKLAFKVEKGTDPSTDKEIAVNNGQATFDWTPKEKGDYSVTVKYTPATDGTGKNYKESTSAVFSLTVGEKGSNPGGNSQGGSSSGGGSISGNSFLPSNTTKDNKQKEEKRAQEKDKKTESKSVFKDVKAKDKSYQAIKFAVEKGLMKEKNHKFNPSGKITAKDVASVLYKMAGRPKTGDKKSAAKKELDKAANFLKETKILSGQAKDFLKGKTITKEQLVGLLYKYAKYKGYDTDTEGDVTNFKDSDQLSKESKTAMTWALENGLITDKNNKLSPKSKVTRKELATILYHFIGEED